MLKETKQMLPEDEHDSSCSDDEEITAADAVSSVRTDNAKSKKKKKKKKKKATSTTIMNAFPSGLYPKGVQSDHPLPNSLEDDNNSTMLRTTNEEKRYLQKLLDEDTASDINKARGAAEVHRRVREYAKQNIKSGMSMISIADLIENKTRELLNSTGLAPNPEMGIAFPTGLSLNHVAAHYTPNSTDNIVLQADDVMKVDFGTHINGVIIDSAFTFCENSHKYQGLIDTVKEATNMGIATAGIDVRLPDIGAAIQEVMEAGEVEINGKVYPVKCIRNLNGHSIANYKIHAGKTVPIVAGISGSSLVESRKSKEAIMEQGEFYAIETFGSTGKGYVLEEGEVSHYMKNFSPGAPANPALRVPKARTLFSTITNNFGTLAFCRRYLDRLGESNYLLGLKHLVATGAVDEYPPLADIRGCYTAQFEHTLYLGPTCKEVLSRGNDY